MDWRVGWPAMLGVAVGVLGAWLALALALWRAAPDRLAVREVLRLLPDLLRLLRGLVTDPELPRPVRWRLWLLLGYLALPLDLVPDFVPVIGYADDAVVVVLALRFLARHGGEAALARHWPGTPEGWAAVCRLTGLVDPLPGGSCGRVTG